MIQPQGGEIFNSHYASPHSLNTPYNNHILAIRLLFLNQSDKPVKNSRAYDAIIR